MSNGKQSDRKKSSSSSHFAAGLCSGLLSAVLLQPADLLKTRIQQSPPANRPATSSLVGDTASLASPSSPAVSKTSPPSPATNKALQPSSTSSSSHTIRACLTEILAQPEPVRELWRGTVASALRTGFGSALYFTTLNAMRREVARLSALSGDGIVGVGHAGPHGRRSNGPSSPSSASALPRLSNTANLATGAVARAFAGLILMPVTVLKVRMESNLHDGHDVSGKRASSLSSSASASSQTKKARSTIRAAIRAIAQTDGMRGFFAGTGATAVRDAPYAGLYVLFYERSKDILGRARIGTSTSTSTSKMTTSSSSSQSAISTNLLSASFAAGLATAVTNPFDAIKTRLQLQPRRYGNMLRAARIMVMHEGGLRRLFDGLALRMGRKALSSAIAWTVYEEIIRRVEM